MPAAPASPCLTPPCRSLLRVVAIDLWVVAIDLWMYRTSPEFVQLVRWLLQADPTKRPSLDDVMDRIEGMGVACPGRLPRSSESSV